MKNWLGAARIFAFCLLFQVFSSHAAEPGAQAQSVSLDSCPLESGEAIAPCNISYRLYGKLNSDRSNAVLVPSWHNGTSADQEKYNYLGPGAMVDTDKYFVIAVDAFGNGASSSPSNQGESPDRNFPEFTIRDMVHSQYRLLTEHLKLDRLHAVVGASMGGYQAYEWMMLYPDYVDRFVAIEASPWVSYYDYVQRRAIGAVLEGSLDTEEELQFASDMVTALDAVTLWTPDYVNREFDDGDHAARFESMRRHQGLAKLLDRASQARANMNHDIRKGRGDFAEYLAGLGRLNVLAVVYEEDMRVNPGPNYELAAMMDFPVITVEGDCGHMGPNPECYQAQTAVHVQAFLDNDRGGDPVGLSRHTREHDGVEREYLVYRPPGTEGQALPLVMALHGYGTTASGLAAIYDLPAHARANGYTLVIPQGSQFMGRFGNDPNSEPYFVTTWNDLAMNFTPAPSGELHCTEDRLKYPCPPECGSCNRCAWTSCYDDLGFLHQVLDQVEEEHSIDSNRVYIVGNSNGATMGMRLACSNPERFAAITSLILQMPPGLECHPGQSLPMFHLAGEQDDTGGFDGTPTSSGWIFSSIERTQQVWAEGMGCRGEVRSWRTAVTDAQGLQCTAYTDCPGEQHEVVSCLDPAAGHEWRGQRDADIAANCVYPAQADRFPQQPPCGSYHYDGEPWGMDMVWQFLSRYRKQ